jgi:WD40 repeat protein
MMTPSVRGWLTGLGAIVILCAGAAAQETDPMNGVWKLNLTKSTFSPGPAPKDMTLTIESAGAGRKVAVTGTAGDGTAIKWGYTGNFDRKENKVTGTNPDADVVMLRRISPRSTRTTYKLAGKQTLVNGVSVSEDGKTLAVAQTGVDGKGQTVKNSLTFDKQ